MTIENTQCASSTFRIAPEARGRWHGETVHLENGRRAAIGSLWDLTELAGEEIDLLAPRDDSHWTCAISASSPAGQMLEDEASQAS